MYEIDPVISSRGCSFRGKIKWLWVVLCLGRLPRFSDIAAYFDVSDAKRVFDDFSKCIYFGRQRLVPNTGEDIQELIKKYSVEDLVVLVDSTLEAQVVRDNEGTVLSVKCSNPDQFVAPIAEQSITAQITLGHYSDTEECNAELCKNLDHVLHLMGDLDDK